MFRFETVVKSFGDPFHVKGRPNAPCYPHQCEIFFLSKAKRNRLKFLNQGLTGLSTMIRMFTTCVGSPRLPFDPLPDLGGVLASV